MRLDLLSLFLGSVFVAVSGTARAASSFPAPVLNEPSPMSGPISPSDLHMEIAPMPYACTDWEVWSRVPEERVWSALCVKGSLSAHIHLGDGIFEGSHLGRRELFAGVEYFVRARVLNDQGEWSDWGTVGFRTADVSEQVPLRLRDVAQAPRPDWRSRGREVLLSEWASDFLDRPKLSMRSADKLLLAIESFSRLKNRVDNPGPLGAHGEVRIRMQAGEKLMDIDESELEFVDDTGAVRRVFLPGFWLFPRDRRDVWVAADGSTYYDSRFRRLARAAESPWAVRQPGYEVELVSSGLQLPVGIALAFSSSRDVNAPLLYVTELYGSIQVVTQGRQLKTYATGLLNYDPTGNFPGTGEMGLAGIAVHRETGDLFVTVVNRAQNGSFYPRILRLRSEDGGLSAAAISTVLELPDEPQTSSHQISSVTFGPDQKLYVHLGDGYAPSTALNLNSARGKILRLNVDGSAPDDNPFYDVADGITARDYVYSYGFRNPFGGAWREADSSLYFVENGPSVNDRLGKAEAGKGFGWNGGGASMTTHAIYSWNPTHAPVGACFVQPGTFGGSGFPAEKQGRLYVSSAGPTYAKGAQSRGKRIVEFELDGQGGLVGGPDVLIEYAGNGRASVAGIAAGPEGIYFSDLYKDQSDSPTARGANIYLVRYRAPARGAEDPRD